MELKVTVVIPVINESTQVALAVDRAWMSGADEVIVVDGGSDDDTVMIARNANCVLVDSPGIGRAVQMNHGAKSASGDILVFLHADNWLVKDACIHIRAAIISGLGEFGAFRQRINSRRVVFRWIETGNGWRLKWQGLIYGDQAMFITKTLFDSVGGFPAIDLMEDFAISRRIRKFGKPIILEGPTFVSARRWEKSGPIRQTFRNWFLAFSFRLGASPAWIAKWYRRHDQSQ